MRFFILRRKMKAYLSIVCRNKNIKKILVFILVFIVISTFQLNLYSSHSKNKIQISNLYSTHSNNKVQTSHLYSTHSNNKTTTSIKVDPSEPIFSLFLNSSLKLNLGTIKTVQNRTLKLARLNDHELENELKHQNISTGGCWSPNHGVIINRVAILIPFRNREEHLNVFLLNMHPLFAKQMLSYCIYLIEPVSEIEFNRGILLNIGFIESNKDANNTWECHAYHDIDLISENEYTPYHCPPIPTHLADKIHHHGYKIPFFEYFGGATILTKEHYIKINGYSNLFFGWGGEDDDHRKRVLKNGLKIARARANSTLGRYKSLSHAKDVPSEDRWNVLEEIRNASSSEGLNTVFYDVVKIEKTKFYSKIYVFYDKQELFERKEHNEIFNLFYN